MARRNVEELEVATVVSQQDGKVTVAIPMVGFPPGFQLEAGDKVVLVDEASGLVARPLVLLHHQEVAPGNAAGFRVTPQAVGSDKLTAQAAAAGGPVNVWTVESSAGGPPRVIAARTSQQ